MSGYIASARPARIGRVSATNLYAVAARELGYALYWPLIARLNGMTDPWITGVTELKIPPLVDKSIAPTGILEV